MTETGRRSPEAARRQRDAERSRRRLLEAAFDEFSRHGYAGARVGRIAEAAGVNKQLISYYFGGKDGLYRELANSWLATEAANTHPQVPAAETMLWYLRQILADPRGTRLLLWQSLGDGSPVLDDQGDFDREQTWMRQRLDRGELADGLDPAALQLVFMAMTMAPVVMPHVVRRLFGVEPDSDTFAERYGAALRDILTRLTDETEPSGSEPSEPTSPTPSKKARTT